ncbi:hypothetical protein FDUTEX481_01248 [Tolypothrix sp. PCC 7601]|nr:hypothetical protein FDUTEX481_01248 [Tolypothrix sp. PCC 7601]
MGRKARPLLFQIIHSRQILAQTSMKIFPCPMPQYSSVKKIN